MATDRNNLAALIRERRYDGDTYGEIADAIIAAGWTPPMSERERAWGKAVHERISREQGKELPEEDGNG